MPRIAQVVDDQHVADKAVHLGRDVGVALVHVEAVHADAAGQLMVDQLGLRAVGDVKDAEAAAAVRLLLGGLDLNDVGLGDVEPLRQFGAVRLAAKRLAQRAAHGGHLLGAPPDRRHVALVVDHHDVAGNAHFVAVRGEVADVDCRNHARIGRIGDVEDRGAEIVLIRNVSDKGILAGDGDLAGAGQIEMADAPHIAGERAVRAVNLVHFYLSIVAPDAFTIACHFGISAAI